MSNIDRQAQKVIAYALAYGASPKSVMAQVYADEFANDSLSRLVHKMVDIQKPPHKKTIACKVVENGGKVKLQYRGYRWWVDSILGTDFVN